MRTIVLGTLVPLMVLALAAGCGTKPVEVELGADAWMMQSNASLKAGTETIKGTNIDLEKNLDIDNEQIRPVGNAGVRLFEAHVIRASVTDFSNKSTKSLTEEVTFDKKTYAVGTTVDAEFDMQLATLRYGWGFINVIDNLYFGPMVGVDVLATQASLEAASVAKVSQSQTFPIPMAGAYVDYDLPLMFTKLTVRGEACGMRYQGSQGKGDAFDAKGTVGFRITDYLELHGGFRRLLLIGESKDGEKRASIGLEGFLAGVTLRFP